HREYLILLALEKLRALLAALQEVLEVTFPAVSIEGIRQLDLHSVFREEGPECITCIAPFECGEITADQSNILGFVLCHMLCDYNRRPSRAGTTAGFGSVRYRELAFRTLGVRLVDVSRHPEMSLQNGDTSK